MAKKSLGIFIVSLIIHLLGKTDGVTIEEAACSANNKFSFELLAQLFTTPYQNTFFSAFNIETALAMVYLGARANTATEMKTVLHFNDIESADSSNNKSVAQAYKDLLDIYNKPNSNLSAANNIYPDKNFTMLKSYTSDIQKYFDVEIEYLDYCTQASQAANTINDWVANKTNNKITDLFGSDSFSCNTKLVLVAAIYFKGVWKTEFDSSQTKKETFYKSSKSGDTVQVDMMSITSNFSFMQGNGYKMVELPYSGGKMCMFVILPDRYDGIKGATNLTSADFTSMINQLYTVDKLLVKLPKFTFKTKYPDMVKTLMDMGIKDLFGSSSDLSGLNGKHDLYADQVVHQAFVKVDEHGTEAAAASGVGINANVVPPQFIANHPFLFLLVHKNEQNILFTGIFMDQTSEN